MSVPISKRCGRARRPARKLQFERLEARVVLSGAGLSGQYFHNPDFTGLAVEQIEAVDFAWGSASPAPGVDADSFSVRWTGQVEALYSETYTFRTVSDEGVRLWVDGQLLIDQWEPHGTQVDTGSIALETGQRYDLRLEYFDQTGSAQIRLQWSSPSQSLEAIPASQLHTSPEGLRGEYTDAFGGNAVRIDPVVDFDWGTGRPHASIAVDQFEVQWSGQIQADFSEEYLFSIQSDEQARLWIGNELVIDDWTPHSTQVETGAKMLEAGKWYDLRLEYSEVSGPAEVELAWSSDRQTGAGQFDVVPTGNLRAAKLTPLQFFNPLGYGADPFAVRANGSYFSISSWGNQIWIDQAENLQNVHWTNPASTSALVWTAPSGTNYSSQVWAPELHRIGDKWYIYFAASDGNNNTHRMYVLERDDPDPMGPYVFKGQINTTPDYWAIDGTVLPWDGNLYFIWSGWPVSWNKQQNIYIAQMSDPLTISSDRVLLSEPDYLWEQYGKPINEGPQILINEGQLQIIYSGSGYWTPQYALGQLAYDGVGPIMDPASWQKSPTPVFQQAGEIVGTGHASFTTSPDGTENWIFYHAHRDPNNGQNGRVVYIQQFDFAADGTPDFGAPIPAETPLTIPSGIPDPERPFVPGDFDASGTVGSSDLDVFSAQFGSTLFAGSSADGNGNGQVDGGDFLLWQRNMGQSAALLESNNPGLAAATLETLASVAPDRTLGGDLQRTWPLDSGLEPLAGIALDGTFGGALQRSHRETFVDTAFARLEEAAEPTSPRRFHAGWQPVLPGTSRRLLAAERIADLLDAGPHRLDFSPISGRHWFDDFDLVIDAF